jgi:hypothetical protein
MLCKTCLAVPHGTSILQLWVAKASWFPVWATAKPTCPSRKQVLCRGNGMLDDHRTYFAAFSTETHVKPIYVSLRLAGCVGVRMFKFVASRQAVLNPPFLQLAFVGCIVTGHATVWVVCGVHCRCRFVGGSLRPSERHVVGSSLLLAVRCGLLGS